jgi:hypothetical protein
MPTRDQIDEMQRKEQRRHEEAMKRQAANPSVDKAQPDKGSKEKDDAS